MLRTEPAALSLPGPFGAAGFHARLSQRQHHACCDLPVTPLSLPAMGTAGAKEAR
ncbi:hypothetical protein LRC83_004530 [Salmonella enterica]|nr:hypothetical protein [Salmonella enterica]